MSAVCWSSLRAGLIRDPTPATYDIRFSGTSTDDWDEDLSNATVTDSTSIKCFGDQSIRARASGTPMNISQHYGGGAEDGPLELDDTLGMMNFYLSDGMAHEDDYSDGNNNTRYFGASGGISLYLRDGSSNQDNEVVYSINNDNVDGWHTVPIVPGDYAGMDVDDVQRILLQVNTSSSNVGNYTTNDASVYFDRIAFYPKQKARLLIRFDDGYDNAYAWAKEAEANGFFVNIAMIPGIWGNSGILTAAEAKELYNDGHACLNHGNGMTNDAEGTPYGGSRWTNTTRDTLNSYENIRDSIISAREDLVSNGMSRFANMWVVPGGANHPEHYKLVQEGICTAVWHAGSVQYGINGTNVPRVWPTGKHEWAMWAGYRIDGKTKLAVTTEINQHIAKGGDWCIYCHNNDADDDMWLNESDGIAKVIGDKVAAGELEVITARDIVHPYKTDGVTGTVRSFVRENINL